MELKKSLGLGIMCFVVIIGFVIGYYVNSAEKTILSRATINDDGSCKHPEGTECPFQELNELAMPKYVGVSLLLIFFLVGAYLFLSKSPTEKSLDTAKKALPNLDEESKKVMDLLLQESGMIFQNELVSKTQLSKVKVTRILDKLEAKGLVERRRRGMINVIILKK